MQGGLLETSGVKTRAMAEKENLEISSEVERQRQKRWQERQAYERQLAEMRSEMEWQRVELEGVKLRAQREKEAIEKAKEEIRKQTQAAGANQDPGLSLDDSSRSNQMYDQLAQALSSLADVLGNLTLPRADNVQTAMADLKTVIRDFKGNEEPEQAGAWIRELENVSTLNGWTDAVALSMGKAHLKDGALKWLLTKMATIVDFISFVQAFKSTFTYQRSTSEKLKAMMTRTQGYAECVQDYFLDKVWLCQGLRLSMAEIQDELVSGLWSRETSNFILSRD